MKILYLGEDSGTCRQRADAMKRLGHDVDLLDPYRAFPDNGLTRRWIYKTGGLIAAYFVEKWMLRTVARRSYDLVWVDGGELISPALVRTLRRDFGPVVNYNHDDPFGRRDGSRWRLYLKCVPFYDLLVVVRACNVEEARKRGARHVELIYRTADEVAHAPRTLSEDERRHWQSDVLLAATWMPERGPLAKALTDAGLSIAIYGNDWQKSPEWPQLKPYWRGPGIYDPEDYARAIQSAKICLGLLSKGNRDLHTTRSMEIPYLGGLLVAERTPEHLALYEQDKEAVFWADPIECVEKCRMLLGDPERRIRIAQAGRARAIANGNLNEKMLSRMLTIASALRPGL